MENSKAPQSDIHFSTILKYGLVLLIVAVAVHVLMWWMFNYLNAQAAKNDPRPSPMAPAQPVRPPEPRLQETPIQDLMTVRASEDEILNSYGWVDPQAGVVRIPISEAMKLMLERGNEKGEMKNAK